MTFFSAHILNVQFLLQYVHRTNGSVLHSNMEHEAHVKTVLEQSARPLLTSSDFFSLPEQLWSTRRFNQEGQANPGYSNLVLLGFSIRAEVGSEPSSRNPVRQQARLLGTLSNTEQQTHQQCGESTWEMASTQSQILCTIWLMATANPVQETTGPILSAAISSLDLQGAISETFGPVACLFVWCLPPFR